FDYANLDEAPGAAAGNDAWAWATALYASFQPQDSKFGFHLRGEYATHSSSFPLGGSVPSISTTTITGNKVLTASSGQNLVFPQKVFALTGTIQYDLWKNVMSRLEVRWDHAADGSSGAFGNTDPITGSGEKKNNYLVAANLI